MTEPNFTKILQDHLSKTTGQITIPIAFLKSLLPDSSDDVLNKLLTPTIKEEFKTLWESELKHADPKPKTLRTVASFLSDDEGGICNRIYKYLTTGEHEIWSIRSAIRTARGSEGHWRIFKEHINSCCYTSGCEYCLVYCLQGNDYDHVSSFLDAYEHENESEDESEDEGEDEGDDENKDQTSNEKKE
jgi:Pyruvate/2-oxoacid:ferredoxin oxidoreductase delta subunit